MKTTNTDKLTEQDFLKIYNNFFGEHLDNVRQLTQHNFTGRELLEFANYIYTSLSQEVKQPNVSAEEMKYLATTFVHKCRLKGIVSSDDTSNLYDEFIKEYALHPHLIQEVKQEDKLDAEEILKQYKYPNFLFQDRVCFHKSTVIRIINDISASQSTEREPKQEGWISVSTPPKDYDEVIVMTDTGDIFDAMYCDDINHSFTSTTPKKKHNNIIYWMERPLAPHQSVEKYESLQAELKTALSPKQYLNVTDEQIKMVNAFYKIAETIDFNKPEHEGLYELIYPFLKTNAELLSPVAIEPENKTEIAINIQELCDKMWNEYSKWRNGSGQSGWYNMDETFFRAFFLRYLISSCNFRKTSETLSQQGENKEGEI